MLRGGNAGLEKRWWFCHYGCIVCSPRILPHKGRRGHPFSVRVHSPELSRPTFILCTHASHALHVPVPVGCFRASVHLGRLLSGRTGLSCSSPHAQGSLGASVSLLCGLLGLWQRARVSLVQRLSHELCC